MIHSVPLMERAFSRTVRAGSTGSLSPALRAMDQRLGA